MKLTTALSFIISISMFSCAQMPVVKNIYAYKTVRLPGTIRVNSQGQQVTPRSFTTYQLFTESSKAIRWQKAWVDGQSYSIAATEVKFFPIQVGQDEITQKPIFINQTSGQKVFQCELIPDEINVPLPKNSGKGKLIIQGVYSNKTILKSIDEVVSLFAPPSV